MKTVKFTSIELIIVAAKIGPSYDRKYRADIKDRVISALIKAKGFRWNDNKFTNENLIAYCNKKGFGKNLKKAAEEFEKLTEKHGYTTYAGVKHVLKDLAKEYEIKNLTVELNAEKKKPAPKPEIKSKISYPTYENLVNLNYVSETVTCAFCGKIIPSKWILRRNECSVNHDECSCTASVEAAARNKALGKEYKKKVAEEKRKNTKKK